MAAILIRPAPVPRADAETGSRRDSTRLLPSNRHDRRRGHRNAPHARLQPHDKTAYSEHQGVGDAAMRRPFLILEDLRTTRRRRLFNLFDVERLATPYAWLSPLFFCVLGIAAALLGHRESSLSSRLLVGVGYSP